MSFREVLDPSRVAIDRAIQSKKGVIEQLSRMFAEDVDGLSASTVFDALIAREKLGSTGLGHGVAIPHGRVRGADRALAALLITDRPVDFDAIDNEPVDIFVGLLVPEQANDTHLELLSELAEMLGDERLTRRLRGAISAGRALDVIADFGKS